VIQIFLWPAQQLSNKVLTTASTLICSWRFCLSWRLLSLSLPTPLLPVEVTSQERAPPWNCKKFYFISVLASYPIRYEVQLRCYTLVGMCNLSACWALSKQLLPTFWIHSVNELIKNLNCVEHCIVVCVMWNMTQWVRSFTCCRI
jgi:hypothetical protein